MKNNKQLYWFIGKCAMLFVVWNVAYYGWLQDTNLDHFITHTTGDISVEILNSIGYDSFNFNIDKGEGEDASYSMIFIPEFDARLGIADSCNALTLIILFIGFIIAYPGDWRYKLMFIAGGTLIIFGINLLRVQVLIFNYLYSRSTFDFNHHVTFTIAVYVCVFYFWVLWANKWSKKKFGTSKPVKHAA
jgi:exosortase family protein XrtF